MASRLYRIGIVGASSLAGKELADELGESVLAASNIVLLDEDESAAGQLTSAGEEPAFIQKLDATSFDGMDFVFFAGDAEVTKRHWQEARKAGASIIDLSYALEAEKDVLVEAPWVAEVVGSGKVADLKTPAVIASHPVALMLALVAAKLKAGPGLKSMAATVMEPASEHGRAAMDEMHQQTVSLLSFQTLPREQYDAQVSFNLLPSLGENAKVKLGRAELRIRTQYEQLGGEALSPLALQMVQAPVFHGYVVSVLIELEKPATAADVEKALEGDHFDLVGEDGEPPSNLSAAGQEDIMVRVAEDYGDAESGTRFWLWMAADNLKLAAINAIACAVELRRLRPSGKVQ
ncbi:MAG: Asd/ArgC dimerization domain-containing protein [Edaphobacter sp.]|uniref:Asd/ArgC dimerization domain-containing protein n=1 Tax=Edaphobacter sp. TaxID=1934404 RepID=UPI002384357C|nr:Asd/ArgC dimerization domain-containing protein [Edaphobacter sp.]MDE1177555.1 Asd/ArgC dimerization domain-containing protein [Edaphobacter sp.]